MRPRRVALAALVAVGSSLALVPVGARPTTVDALKLKLLKLPAGNNESLSINDWVATKSRASVAVATRGRNSERDIGIFTVKTNGKLGPFTSINPEGRIPGRGRVVWPAAGRSGRRPPRGLLFVLDKAASGGQMAIRTGVLLASGRVRGSLRERATLETGTSSIVLSAETAVAGNRVALVVAFGVLPPHGSGTRVVLFEFDLQGKPLGPPIDLTIGGTTSSLVVQLGAVIATKTGWLVIGDTDPPFNSAPRDESVLYGWRIDRVANTSAARAASVDAKRLESLQPPEAATAARLAGGSAVPGTAASIFYDRSTFWPIAELRARRIPAVVVERRLRDLEADGLTRGAPSTVEIEPWPRIQEIFDAGSTTYPATYSELTSALLADGGRDPLFAVARAATLASPGASSFREPRQEFSIYRFDAARARATLVARVERTLDVGGASAQLLRIGSKNYVLFRYGFTFAFEPVLLFGEVPG